MRFTLRSIMLTILVTAVVISPFGSSIFARFLLSTIWTLLPAVFVTLIVHGTLTQRTAASGGLATFVTLHLSNSLGDHYLPLGITNASYLVNFVWIAISMGLSAKCHDWLMAQHTLPQSPHDSDRAESDDAG